MPLWDREIFDRIFSPGAKEVNVNTLWVSDRLSELMRNWWWNNIEHSSTEENIESGARKLSQDIINMLWDFLKKNKIHIPIPNIRFTEKSGYVNGTVDIGWSDLEKFWMTFNSFIIILSHELWHHIIYEYAKILGKKIPTTNIQEEFCDFIAGYVLSKFGDIKSESIPEIADVLNQVWIQTELFHLTSYWVSPTSNELKVHSQNLHWTWSQRVKRLFDGFELWDFWLQLKLMQCFMRNRHLR